MKQLCTGLRLLLLIVACVGCNKRVALQQAQAIATGTAPVTSTAYVTPTPTPSPTPAARWFSKTSHVWATLDRSTTFNSTTNTVILFDNVIEDPLQEYNKLTGIFAPKANGLYSIQASLTLPGPWATGDYCKLHLSKAQLTIKVNMTVMPVNQNQCVVTISAVVPLAIGEGVLLSSIIAGAEKRTNALVNNPYVTLQIAKVGE